METAIDLKKIKNVHTKTFTKKCIELGIKCRPVFDNHSVWVATKKGGEELMYKAVSPLNSAVYSKLSKNKRETIFTLKKAGIPVPEQVRIKSYLDLQQFFKLHPKLVVKPIDSHGGKGVTVLPKETELYESYNRALNISEKMIAEEFIPGHNYRFLVLDDRVLAVAIRLPPFVIGDGKTAMITLTEQYNTELRKKGIPQVKMTDYTWNIIANQGYTKTDVIPEGKQVFLRLTANLSQGGTVKDVTATVDQTYKDLAVKAAKAVHLRLGGIDFIADDITKPGSDCRVIETNAAPGMRIHYKDPEGAKLDVARDIVIAVSEL